MMYTKIPRTSIPSELRLYNDSVVHPIGGMVNPQLDRVYIWKLDDQFCFGVQTTEISFVLPFYAIHRELLQYALELEK